MNCSLSKLLTASLAAAAMANGVYAIPKGPCDKPVDVCCEEPKPGPFAFAYPKDLNLACPKDFYIYGQAMAFQAKQDGLEFAIQNNTSLVQALLGMSSASLRTITITITILA